MKYALPSGAVITNLLVTKLPSLFPQIIIFLEINLKLEF